MAEAERDDLAPAQRRSHGLTLAKMRARQQDLRERAAAEQADYTQPESLTDLLRNLLDGDES